MGAPLNQPLAPARRLTRTMSSRKLQALDFIKRYFAQWGYSPALSELAAELDISIKRAHDLVHQLATEEMITIVAGARRGIRLIDRGEEVSDADVLVRLSKMGWTIAAGSQVVQPPGSQQGPAHELAHALLRTLTEKGLHTLPELDHVEPSTETEPGWDHDQGEGPIAA